MEGGIGREPEALSGFLREDGGHFTPARAAAWGSMSLRAFVAALRTNSHSSPVIVRTSTGMAGREAVPIIPKAEAARERTISAGGAGVGKKLLRPDGSPLTNER